MAGAMTEEERIARDVAMATDQDNWPMWPMLPVKRWRNTDGNLQMDAGVLAGTTSGITEPKVWVNASPWGVMGTVYPMEYPDMITLFNDGWKVD